ncbi:MAG: NAD-binding protein [Polyangiaceae bacterium]
MRSVSLGDRLRYRFDSYMSRGAIALVGALFILSAFVIVFGATLVHLSGEAPDGPDGKPGFFTLLWMSGMRAMDAGTLGGDDGSKLYLFFWLLVTIGGVFIVSAFIGIINNGLSNKLEQLRKGRSRVIEENHTLVLGWSSHVPTIVGELCLAAESAGGTTIVILADRDKVEMEDELRVKVPNRRDSKIVCRSGSPIDLDDLALGSPEAAKAIVVVGAEGTADPDAGVIKTVLALVSHLPREEGTHHIVAEIRDPKNLTPAKMVGGDQVEIVLTADVIARIAVQTCRQTGLSGIFLELLDFGGDEIYLHPAAEVAGETFGDALGRFEDSTLIGVVDGSGETRLNPPMSTPITKAMKLVVIAADDSCIRASGGVDKIDERLLSKREPKPQKPEKTLILGWNARGATIVRELDKYAVEGSALTIVSDDGVAEAAIDELRPEIRHHAIRTVRGDITDRKLLDSLELHGYEHVITLSYGDKMGVQEADAVTLVALLHLRDIEEKHGESFSTVSEMLDVRNQRLAEVTQADDFIVSDMLVSLLMAQLAETKGLAPVFADLFDADGSEIYLKEAANYVKLDADVDFATIVESARRRNEVAIGILKSGRGSRAQLNPSKRERLRLGASDRVVVIAEA